MLLRLSVACLLVVAAKGVPQYTAPPPTDEPAACEPVTLTQTTTQYQQVTETSIEPIYVTSTQVEIETLTNYETVTDTQVIPVIETLYETEIITEVLPTTTTNTQVTYATVYETETEQVYITQTETATKKEYTTVCPKPTYS